MESTLDNEELVKRFLLGNLSDSERAEIEDRFLASDDFYQELRIVEADLTDAYVRGELPASERAVFESSCAASPGRRERVEFAQTLFKSVSSKVAASTNAATARVPDQMVSWWRSLLRKLASRPLAIGFAVAAAALVVALGGLWLMTDRSRNFPTPPRAGTRQTTSAPAPGLATPITETAQERTKQEKDRANGSAAGEAKKTTPVIATFTLLPGMVRGGGGAQLALPTGATEVRLRLTLEGEAYAKYRATLSTPEGKKLWTHVVTNGHSMKSPHLTLKVPADLLNNGDYVLGVSGANVAEAWESVADYSFRVVRK